MPEFRTVYTAPIPPNNMLPQPGADLPEFGVNFSWELGTLSVTSFRLFLSNNINGHLPGHSVIPNEQLSVSPTFNGNTFSPESIPQGYPIFYVTLEYTSSGQLGYLQESYNTNTLEFITHNEGDTLKTLSPLLVAWTGAGDGQS